VMAGYVPKGTEVPGRGRSSSSGNQKGIPMAEEEITIEKEEEDHNQEKDCKRDRRSHQNRRRRMRRRRRRSSKQAKTKNTLQKERKKRKTKRKNNEEEKKRCKEQRKRKGRTWWWLPLPLEKTSMPLRAKKMCGAAGVNSSSHVSGAKAKSLQKKKKKSLHLSAIITGAS